jgi:AraC family transcriptional regulator, transcriptional activator FtrA
MSKESSRNVASRAEASRKAVSGQAVSPTVASHKVASRTGESHKVALLVSDGSNPFEMSVATETFGMPRPELDVRWYDFIVCASEQPVTMRGGLFCLTCSGTLADARRADTLIVPNRPDPREPVRSDVIDTIRAAYRRGARIMSFCTGAFTLAEAGILDGHRVTTHWRWTDEFSRRFPSVELTPDVLFVDDGQILSAAGSAAALDLCLAVIRHDYGSDVMRVVSQRLVFAANREGGQRQFMPTNGDLAGAGPAGAAPVDLAEMMQWASRHLGDPLTVADLAARASISVSTLHRLAPAGLGTSPLQWLQARRVDEARQLLERTDLDVETVASRCGLGTSTNLRTYLKRSTGLTPTQYRARFR